MVLVFEQPGLAELAQHELELTFTRARLFARLLHVLAPDPAVAVSEELRVSACGDSEAEAVHGIHGSNVAKDRGPMCASVTSARRREPGVPGY